MRLFCQSAVSQFFPCNSEEGQVQEFLSAVSQVDELLQYRAVCREGQYVILSLVHRQPTKDKASMCGFTKAHCQQRGMLQRKVDELLALYYECCFSGEVVALTDRKELDAAVGLRGLSAERNGAL